MNHEVLFALPVLFFLPWVTNASCCLLRAPYCIVFVVKGFSTPTPALEPLPLRGSAVQSPWKSAGSAPRLSRHTQHFTIRLNLFKPDLPYTHAE